MKTQNSNSKIFKTKLKPILLAINLMVFGAVLSQAPVLTQSAHAVQAEKPAGAGTAIIAVNKATDASTADLIKAAAALKAKGYDVKFALPTDPASAAAIKKAATAGGFGSIAGTAQEIAAAMPGAVAYGDKFAVNIAAQLKGQKADATGAYDLNGKLTAADGATSATILSNTQASVAALTGAVAGPLQTDVEIALSQGDLELMKQLELAGVDPSVAVMPFPTTLHRAGRRYGEWRSSVRFHAGWDLSTPGLSRIPLTWMGMASGVKIGGGSGNSVHVTRLNGDEYYFFHMDKPVNRCIGRENWPKKPGDPSFCGVVGNTGLGEDGDVHLHMGYGVAGGQWQSRRRQTWLPSRSSARTTYSGKAKLQNIGLHSDSTGATFNSDITPYMSHDMVVLNDYNSPWLGSTMRQQFNALYGTRLPTGGDDKGNLWPTSRYDRGASQISSASLSPITNVPRWGKYAWTPDQIAAARSGTIKGMYSGAFPEGMYMASPQMIASFLLDTDGAGFGTLPQLAETPDITKQSPREIIQNISKLRYGNAAWHQAMTELSSKAMMSEYIAMGAAENFIEQQNSLVMQRVESLMAGLIRSRSAGLQGRIEAIEEVAVADVVPDLINTQVAVQEYAYAGGGAGLGGVDIDLSSLPNGVRELTLLLFEALSVGESNSDYNAYNTGTKNGNSTMRSCYSNKPNCRVPTTMTVGEILSSSSLPSTNINRIFAVGRYQIITKTLTDAVNRGAISRNTVFTPAAQDSLIDGYFLKHKRPTLGKFVKGGNVSVDQAQLQMGMEWAAIGIPAGVKNKYGKVSDGFLSYYAQTGVNSSHKKTTATLRAILIKINQVHKGGGAAPTVPPATPATP